LISSQLRSIIKIKTLKILKCSKKKSKTHKKSSSPSTPTQTKFCSSKQSQNNSVPILFFPIFSTLSSSKFFLYSTPFMTPNTKILSLKSAPFCFK
jgi:hypothetical protein